MSSLYTTSMHLAYSTPNLVKNGGDFDKNPGALTDDVFKDTADYMAHKKPISLVDTLADVKIAMDLFLTNRFDEAEEKLRPMANKTMYHALGYSTILFLKAMMTCDRDLMEKAMEASQNAQNTINRFRAQYSIADSFLRLSGTYKRLNDEEVHAELCYAESLMGRALLTFFYDENLTSFIRGAFKIRTCYQSYKECQRILHSNQYSLRHDQIKKEFEAGVCLGLGCFNLMLSVLPSKLLKLLEIIGFSGDKAIGMRDLGIAAGNNGTLRSTFSQMILANWQLFIIFVVSDGKPNLIQCQDMMAPLNRDYPNGAIILFMKARHYLVTGDFTNAIFFYNKSIECQNIYKQFHHICYWELQFAYAALRRWDRSANHAKLLKDESRWSQCVYTYLLAIYINADESYSKEERNEVVTMLMQKIPQVRMRIAGKSIPVEKYCERKANRFLKLGKLYYPHYEFMYFFNVFTILEPNPTPYITDILEDIEKVWRENPSDDPNDLCVYEFLRGVCFRCLKKYDKAGWSFNRIICYELNLTDNYYFIPFAVLELGLTKKEMGKHEEAAVLFQKAKVYKSFSMENKLHFKLHSVS